MESLILGLFMSAMFSLSAGLWSLSVALQEERDRHGSNGHRA